MIQGKISGAAATIAAALFISSECRMRNYLRRILPAPMRRGMAAVIYGALDAADRVFGDRDNLIPPRAMMFVGSGDFETVGNQFVQYFCDAGLHPDHRVLDVGCGIGRMAIPLTRYLSTEGSYEGFDVVKRGVTWCSRKITPRFPNFHFQFVPLHNRDYNPRGSEAAAMFRFPFADGSFDFVFLTSVFTHMLPTDVDHYMVEIARVLKPGGICFITWFLLNDESHNLIAAGRSTLDFKQALEDGLTVDAAIPEQAVAYAELRVLAWYRRTGLEPDHPLRYGAWCGREAFVDYQDIVVARKSASSDEARAGGD